VAAGQVDPGWPTSGPRARYEVRTEGARAGSRTGFSEPARSLSTVSRSRSSLRIGCQGETKWVRVAAQPIHFARARLRLRQRPFHRHHRTCGGAARAARSAARLDLALARRARRACGVRTRHRCRLVQEPSTPSSAWEIARKASRASSATCIRTIAPWFGQTSRGSGRGPRPNTFEIGAPLLAWTRLRGGLVFPVGFRVKRGGRSCRHRDGRDRAPSARGRATPRAPLESIDVSQEGSLHDFNNLLAAMMDRFELVEEHCPERHGRTWPPSAMEPCGSRFTQQLLGCAQTARSSSDRSSPHWSIRWNGCYGVCRTEDRDRHQQQWPRLGARRSVFLEQCW